MAYKRPMTKRRAAVGAAALGCAGIVLLLALRFVHLSLNTSASMPVGLYRMQPYDRPAARGDVIIVCAPPDVSRIAQSRGYVPRGACDDGTAPLLKYVAATGGDIVTVTMRGIRIDGALLRESAALGRDGLGRPMRAYRATRTRLRPGDVWLYAPQRRSFDSRYFGPVATSRIRSFATLLVPFERDSLQTYRF